MERYFGSLELIYNQKGFIEAKDKALEDKMRFHMKRLKATGSWSRYTGLMLMDVTSKFGLSFTRWAATTFIIILVFAVAYALMDSFSAQKVIANITNYGFEYFYYSVVNFTTLGYGDFVPHTILQRLVTTVEVFTGYTMLGMLIYLIMKRM